MHEDLARILIDEDRIARRVAELAPDIERVLSTLPGDVVLMPVMTGAMIFAADLVRRIGLKVRIRTLTVASYPGTATSSQGASLVGQIPDDVAGANVLVIDDILDSGGTLSLLRDALRERGARSVRACVLMRKTVARKHEVPCEWIGFEIPDEFVVGYGLDYDNHYRNLPYIGVLRGELA